ncbi:hypothetical protein [Paenibacillus sp. R14(2021)]|uniref:hypothetical protein n=1 Tax=Paenibacillus sp. R14(2021) TaxID=2859228 RepID=UPI001C616283|nr:hypothetical protein [Paenibacillus sp. R14(2021)]
MEEQQTKRPIFTPIVLILLTFSLIGNVFLYTKTLQNAQTDRIKQGTEILQAGNGAKQFLSQAVAEIDSLLSHQDIVSRLTAKSRLIAAYRQASELTLFVNEAEAVNGKQFPAAKRGAAEFVNQTLASLQAIGNHEGALSSGETAYLNGILQVFKACQSELASFQHDTINQEQSLIILVDSAWPVTAGKLLGLMNEPDNLVFQP